MNETRSSSLLANEPLGVAYTAVVELTDSQKNVTEFYLHRIRLFWNLVLTECKDIFQDYLNSPNTASNDQKLAEQLNYFYNTVRYVNFAKEGITLTRVELTTIEQIRELQNTVLRNRLADIYRIYLRSKTLILEGRKNCAIPKIKAHGDRQSIRFDPSDYIVSGNTLTITGEIPIVFEIPNLHRVDFKHPKAVTLNFSPRSRRLKNPLSLPKKVPFYYLTFSDAYR